MEDRYEIRGKIGQGGLGSVYRAQDLKMNREVAVKRILSATGDPELFKESTRQLIQEAGALAAFQHPHIVTIYDVGEDEDGPYVVMELINGKTLDELLQNAPLTWHDFRELALQTQEALIAAHEHNLIHSDLKPSNIMLSWLPSGKFQVKIVDFGLATLAQSQTKEDLEAMEAVFGSIFFMPPEQFERSPLDTRSDLYSIGCVYYQALTGMYPFSGSSGSDVMHSHLRHDVVKIQDVQPDIPLWACDWIMWHLNRYPKDRPESARDSLSVFLANDRVANPPLSRGPATPPVPPPSPAPTATAAAGGPPKPRIGAAQPAAPSAKRPAAGAPAATAAKPTPTAGKPKPTATAAVQAPERTVAKKTAPQPLAPPVGSLPSVHTSTQEIPISAPATAPVTQTTRQHHVAPAPTSAKSEVKTKAKAPVKKAPADKGKIFLLSFLVLAAGIVGFLAFRHYQQKSGIVRNLVEKTQSGATVEISPTELQVIMKATSSADSAEVEKITKALAVARISDGGTNIEEEVAKFVSKSDPGDQASIALITNVLGKDSIILTDMLELSKKAKNPAVVAAALESIRKMSNEEQFSDFMDLVDKNPDSRVQRAAIQNLEEIIRQARKVEPIRKELQDIRTTSTNGALSKVAKDLIDICNQVDAARGGK